MKAPVIAQRVLPHVAKLHAYVPGIQPSGEGWVKLNTNECPYAPSPRVAEAIQRQLGGDGASLRLYPDPTSAALRAVVARHHGLQPSQVCIGNGSDDILNLLVRCFCSVQSAAGLTQPSYSLYPVLVSMQDGSVKPVRLDRSMSLPVEEIAASDAGIFFLTSPNAPTGAGFERAQISRILETFRGILVVDEAYAPFATENAVGLLERHSNLVVVRTLSKAYALAGIRVGYALAHPEVIDVLDRVRDSYNVSRLSQVAACAAIEDQDYYAKVIGKIISTRDLYANKWRQERGWFTFPSQSNFICTEPMDSQGRTGLDVAKAAYDFLFSRKVLVRHFPSDALTASFLRISVGTDAEMLRLDETFDAWLKAPPNA